MSYCVHCGVKLADYETRCPLCETEVIDPNRTKVITEPTYQDRMDINGKKLNKRFLIMLISLALLIPVAVIAVIDLVFSSGLTWAFYVFGAMLIIWTFIVFPIYFEEKSPYLYLAADLAVSSLYILMLSWLNSSVKWLMSIALPLILSVGLCVFLIIFVLQAKRIGKIEKGGWIGIIASFLPWAIDIAVTHYLTGSFVPVWAWYVSSPLIILGIVLVVASKSVSMSEWIRRNLFF